MDATFAQEFRPTPTPAAGRIALGLLLTALAVPGVLFGAFLLWLPHTVRYATSSAHVTVTMDHRIAQRTRSFGRGEVVAARAVELPHGRRQVGTAMPGYCVGTFSYGGIGRVWQATDCSRDAVLLQFKGKPQRVVLTPADRAGFLAALDEGRDAAFAPNLSARAGAGWWAVKIAVLLLVPLTCAVPAVFFVAPGRLRYRVRQGALEVRTLLASRHVEVLGSVVTRYRPRKALKLAGSGFPGYFTGWFLLDGARTRVYATTLREGVLIEGKSRVFVTPADPEGLLAALVAAGAHPAWQPKEE